MFSHRVMCWQNKRILQVAYLAEVLKYIVLSWCKFVSAIYFFSHSCIFKYTNV